MDTAIKRAIAALTDGADAQRHFDLAADRIAHALLDVPIPPRTTPEAEAVLRALTYNRAAGRCPPAHWFTTLRDAPREGMVRPAIAALAAASLLETP